MTHGGGLLAVGAELGPQLDDGSVVAEDAALGEHVYHCRGYALADRKTKERRIRRYQTFGRRISDARDGVDHRVALPADRHMADPRGPGPRPAAARGAVDHRVALPVDRHLQTPLGSGLDNPVDGFLDLLLDVVHDRSPSQWWIVGRQIVISQ